MPAFFAERVGGVEVQTYLIAKHLSRRSWDVHFIAETQDPSKAGTCEPYEGIHVHWIRRRSLLSFYRRDLVATLRAISPAVLGWLIVMQMGSIICYILSSKVIVISN